MFKRKGLKSVFKRKRSRIDKSAGLFEAAFQQRIGVTPEEWVRAKIENGSEKDAVKYLFDICAAEIASQYNCREQAFERYYHPNMEKKEAVVMRQKPSKIYNKLVRDRIPEIIEASGKKCVFEILPRDRYLAMLDEKLNEELAEYQQSKSLEELADLLEVMGAVVHARGYTWSQLTETRKKKVKERGGFEKRILLREVWED